MKIGSECTVCAERVTDADTVQCDVCGQRLHRQCEEYVTKFDCDTCGDETWIGAVEF